ncbi:MAG: PKD domain-containing protein [Rhodothermales bacterium]|nr:PKD domain-containing protein [Rhodothermales bacterium]
MNKLHLRTSVLLILLCVVSETFAQEVDREEISQDPSERAWISLQAVPTGYFLEDIATASSFDTPVGVTFASDGRIFVVEKRGRVYIVENGVKLSTPFIDLEAEVLNHWDRGLLGFALDPDFDNNGHVYLLYTFDRDGTGDYQRQDVGARLTRYTTDSINPDVIDYSTRNVLIGETFAESIPSCYYSHTIGTLQFGSDGTLLVGAGDGADFGQIDPGGLHPDCFQAGLYDAQEDIGAFRSQYLGSLAGKVLRIDPETGAGLDSNPFYTGDPTQTQSKIWALGLRNPYRYSIRHDGSSDPSDGDPGTLFIGDVGWGTWEDLHISHGGENFGWPCYEGPNTHTGYQAQTPAHSDCSSVTSQDSPDYYWHHGDANLSFPTGLQANAIVAGDLYNGSRYPASLNDRLFYADYTRGWVSSSSVDSDNNLSDHQLFGEDLGAIVDIRHDRYADFIYLVDVGAGEVFRLRHDDENSPPVAVATATPTSGYAPLQVQFFGSSSSDPDSDPLTYFWDFGNGETATTADTTVVFNNSGVFSVSLTVEDPSGAVNEDVVQIAVGNTYPVAQIIQPANGSSFAIGDYVSLVGEATDAEDNAGDIQYDWKVTQVHNSHNHPDFFYSSGPTAGFSVIDHGVPYEVNYLEIELMVTDSGGLTDTVRHYTEVGRPGETDITSLGTPIASTLNPTGSGNSDIGVIADGVMPDTSETNPLLQYDTYTGANKTEDWIGYSFGETRYLSKLVLHEGLEFVDGGWFDSVGVQVLMDGNWSDVNYASFIRPFEYQNGISFDRYTILFEAVWADGVRLIGKPGGSATFISVSELRVFELPTSAFTYSTSSGSSPMSVSFSDNSTVSNPISWLWEFGDGQTSTDQDPTHFFSAPGAYDITLSVTGDGGTFVSNHPRAVVIGASGLLGQYYDDEDFAGTRLLRNDSEVDFQWASGAPDASMGADEFSVAWSGWVKPDYTELYTFYTVSDDGIRLWIDNQLVIDKWILQAATEWSGTIPLESDRWYPVRIEYYEHFGQASAELHWESGSETKSIVPSSALRASVLSPAITHFHPAVGNVGDPVTIYGKNLESASAVTFDGTDAGAITVVSPKEIIVSVPAGSDTGELEVWTSEGSVTSDTDFEVDVTLAASIGSLTGQVDGQDVTLQWILFDAKSARSYLVEHRSPDNSEFVTLFQAEVDESQNEAAFSYNATVDEPGPQSFRVGVRDAQGSMTYSNDIELAVELSLSHKVSRPYPNPFSDVATVDVLVRENQHVTATVYDVLGRRLGVVLDDDLTGSTKVSLQLSSSGLTNGLYFVRVRGERFVEDVSFTVLN